MSHPGFTLMSPKSIHLKYLVTIIFMLLLSMPYGSAQRRVNGPPPPSAIIEKSSPPLSQATGWELNQTTGRWVSNENIILDHSLTEMDWYNGSGQYFAWLRIARTRYGGERFYTFYWSDNSKTDTLLTPRVL